jgi:signal transduction histidine kinase
LVDHLEEKRRNFRMIWEVSATTHGVYFRAPEVIFRWHEEKLMAWPGSYHYMTAIRDTIYLVDKTLGLRRLVGDSLQTVPGGEKLAKTVMYVALPFDDHSILLGTRTNGLYVFDGNAVEPFPTEANEFLRRRRVYYGVKIPGIEPLWALGTTDAGLIIIDRQGRVKQIVNKAAGLLDEKIHIVFRDRQGALWLSQNNGLSRIEFPSPFSIFDERLGLVGTPHAIARHEGRIYVATNRGLYRLTSGITAVSPGQPDILSQSRFEPVRDISLETITGVSAQIWSLLSVEEDLLVGAAERIYRVRGNDVSVVAETEQATYCLYQPPDKQDLVYAGLRDGLGLIKKTAGRWQFKGRIVGLDARILKIVQEKPNLLWIGTASQGVFRAETKDEAPLTPDFSLYGSADGLPEGWAYVGLVDDRLVVTTKEGLYRFNTAGNFFEPDTLPGNPDLVNDKQIGNLVQDKSGRIWMMSGEREGKIMVANPDRDPEGGYSWQHSPFQRLTGISSLMDLLPEEDGRVWFVGRDQKIYSFDSSHRHSPDSTYLTMVRQVVSLKADSVLWAGALPSTQTHPALFSGLPFKHNSVRFEYAAASYAEPAANRYQFMLEGYDDDWSRWTEETRKDYTGLPAGDYSFRVRAKNIYGEMAEEGFFSFSILSPWYQKSWAYLLYFFAIVGVIVTVVKTRVRHLEKKTRALEAIVEDRTAEIAKQAEELKEMDRIKSRFFANISHEFRTPLTLILGPIDDALQKIKDNSIQKNLDTAKRSAGHLQRLIDQLLDLSKLEAGGMKLQVQKTDLVQFMQRAVMLFASLADQRKIKLEFQAEPTPEHVECYFDRDIVEKITNNLLSNALKFTPAGSEISVTVSGKENAVINVKDSGVGIAKEDLPHIFDRFYHTKSKSTDLQEGTGIGLALTRELVSLHHGEISVSSEAGKGSDFRVTLPITRSSYTAENIVTEKSRADEAVRTIKSEAAESEPIAETSAVPPEDADSVVLPEDITTMVPSQVAATVVPPEDAANAVRSEDAANVVPLEDVVTVVQPEDSATVLSPEDTTSEVLPEDAGTMVPPEDATLVLVVEDHIEVRQYIREHLTDDYYVLEAANGSEGLSAALKFIPDLVISDIMMPEMDGHEFCRLYS